MSYCLAAGIAFVIKGEKEFCVAATAVVCKVAVLFSLCGVGQRWLEWGCGSQAHGRQLLPEQIKNVFHAQQLQQLCRLLPRAGLPLDCPYSMDPLTCWPSALLEGDGKGSIFISENLSCRTQEPLVLCTAVCGILSAALAFCSFSIYGESDTGRCI